MQLHMTHSSSLQRSVSVTPGQTLSLSPSLPLSLSPSLPLSLSPSPLSNLESLLPSPRSFFLSLHSAAPSARIKVEPSLKTKNHQSTHTTPLTRYSFDSQTLDRENRVTRIQITLTQTLTASATLLPPSSHRISLPLSFLRTAPHLISSHPSFRSQFAGPSRRRFPHSPYLFLHEPYQPLASAGSRWPIPSKARRKTLPSTARGSIHAHSHDGDRKDWLGWTASFSRLGSLEESPTHREDNKPNKQARKTTKKGAPSGCKYTKAAKSSDRTPSPSHRRPSFLPLLRMNQGAQSEERSSTLVPIPPGSKPPLHLHHLTPAQTNHPALHR
ncbi:hypothetical protein IE53DRAFT_236103 [Violaceomyces palustris]|uniref:Uncharacterized protein n=1 Tax=Violaceomyces palustris TaxID=1673888 RepID=A0ACD0NPF1_9BASI|nr:hypothetical protein IE53DRAFT_236103 [Violaceomyces palustris]